LPISFLTPAERERLSRFPGQLPDDDLFVFFRLSDDDHRVINHQREDSTRLGFALQLCALCYLGFAPDDLSTAPWEAVVYVARQLHVPPEAIETYGHRIKTRTTHLQLVQAHLGFRRVLPLDFYALQTWLVDRALEHDQPTLLLQLVCEKLRRDQIVRPGITRLERLVATARQQAHDETFRRLTPLLTEERMAFLDRLLIPDPEAGRTVINWLRREATSHSAPQMVETLKKVTYLLDAGVKSWDLAALNPNRVKWLAQLGWKTPTHQLQRLAPLRRHPILAAFVHQALQHHTDIAVELYDQCLWEYYGAAKQELIEFRKAIARSTNEKLMLLRALGQVLLDPEIENAAVRAERFARVPEEVLRAAVSETEGLIRPHHDGCH
jgi:hypothetical protein